MSEDVPRCECHDEPQLWHKDARLPKGGSWRCRPGHYAAGARYRATDKGRDTNRRSVDTYRLTDKGRAYNRRRILRAATRAREARSQQLKEMLR